MATCREIITRALQQAGVVPLGRDPTAKEMTAGMFALQGLYDGWFSGGMFGRLVDVEEADDYEPNEGERVFGGATLTLPTQIALADTESGYRAPYELSAIVDVTNGNNWLWIDGAWVDCAGLDLADEAPLSSRDREGLSALVASYLSEGYGGTVGQMTARRGLTFQASLSMKSGATRKDRAGDYF